MSEMSSHQIKNKIQLLVTYKNPHKFQKYKEVESNEIEQNIIKTTLRKLKWLWKYKTDFKTKN